MSTLCICGHAKSQHPNKVCDYAGHSCDCKGYTTKKKRVVKRHSLRHVECVGYPNCDMFPGMCRHENPVLKDEEVPGFKP
jgi:hypothetical protein